jgi:DnaK suppressor protein
MRSAVDNAKGAWVSVAKTKTKATAKKTATRVAPGKGKPSAKVRPAKSASAKRAAATVAKAKPKPKIAPKPAAKPTPKVISKPAPPKLVSVKSSPRPPALAIKSAVKSAVKATPAKIAVGSAGPAFDARLNRKRVEGKNGKSAKVTTSTIIPPPAPPRSGKPGKNQAGFSIKELEYFRDVLLQKRRELVGDMRSMESEALQRSGENLSNLPLHMADMGTDNYEQEFTLGLMEKDRQLLREINQALSKIMDGRYGICEGTGKVIMKARLEVQPWAKYSIEHARKLENRGVR